MSKSEGTSILVSDLKKKGFSALVLRYFFLQAHYRSKQNFSLEALEASQKALKKLKNKISEMKDGGKVSNKFKEKFKGKLEDDFALPEALTVVYEVLKSDLSDKDKKATILDFDKVLGLKLSEKNSKKEEKVPEKVALLVEKRQKAREEKNWEQSDDLREKINKLGYKILDTGDKQKIEKI
jgi:cysteinyl-tRNA synthetase